MLKTIVLLHIFRILWWSENKKEQHLFETEMICSINVFTVTFDQFNASLLNKSTNLFKKSTQTDTEQ